MLQYFRLSTYLPFVMVPQKNVVVIETLGKYSYIMEAGLNWKKPILDIVAHKHSLKEQFLQIDSQHAITKDNVQIKINGVLYYKIIDGYNASYNVQEPIRALSLLAQTSMRSEIGKLELDRTFQERASLNTSIREALNQTSEKWGIDCLRYEIKDIKPPSKIQESMARQSESERIKRSTVLKSEGQKQSQINEAEGIKQSLILQGEGEAERILQEARSLTEAIRNLGDSIQGTGGHIYQNAMKLRITEQYLSAMQDIYGSVKIVGLPESFGQDKASSGGNGGQDLTKEIVKAMLVAKETVGGQTATPMPQLDPS